MKTQEFIAVRCEKMNPCKHRIIGELTPGSTGRFQCPRCNDKYIKTTK
ncbi:MAG TPA: hypothetical protein VNM69_17965 [Bacillus sp. (in: firmicutes)]|nr:hypothetical protein [Bacillus sp. (in: firmicutes)]